MSTKFAKFTFLIVVCNGKSDSTEEQNVLSFTQMASQELQNNPFAQQQEGELSQKLIDFNMLDYVLDYFMKSLLSRILPVDRDHNEVHSPQISEEEAERILTVKVDILEVFSDMMRLMSPEMNIRQFDGLRYIDAFIHVINFAASAKIND